MADPASVNGRTMKRLVGTIFVGMVLATLPVMFGPRATAKELRLAHFLAVQHPYHGVFEALGEELSKATNGAITIRIFPGGELGANPVQQFNRVVDGIADIVFALPGYTAPRFPRMLLSEYPGIVDDAKDLTRGLNKAFDQGLFAEEFRRVKVLALWNIRPAALFMRERQIRSVDDLRGLKIRVAAESGARLVEAWGATPVFMPVTQMYNAVQTGVVDGALIDPGAAQSFGLQEVADTVTVGMDSVLTTFFLAMNLETWNDLGSEGQIALDRLAGLSLSEQLYDSWVGISDAGLDSMRQAGNAVIELAPEEADRIDGASKTILERVVADLESLGIAARAFVGVVSGK